MLDFKIVNTYIGSNVKALTENNEVGEIVGLTTPKATTQANPIRISIQNEKFPTSFRDSFFDYNEIKLVLHPLSFISKYIGFEGKKIIPIVELAKEFHKSEYEVTHYEIVDNFRVKCFVENSKDRYMYFDIEPGILNNQYKIVEKVRKMLIDTDGLIDKGLAVDINTL